MSFGNKDSQCQYVAQQVAFLQQAQCDWTTALQDYTRGIILEIELWINDSTGSTTTFLDVTQMAQNAVIFITEKQAEIKYLSHSGNSSDMKDFESSARVSRTCKTNNQVIKNLQSRIESLENGVASLRSTTRTMTDIQKKFNKRMHVSIRDSTSQQILLRNRAKQFIKKLNHVQGQGIQNRNTIRMLSDSLASIQQDMSQTGPQNDQQKEMVDSGLKNELENLGKQKQELDALAEALDIGLRKLSSDINNLEGTHQNQFLNCKTELEKLQTKISAFENNTIQEDNAKYKNLELNMLLKKLTLFEHLRDSLHQKVNLKDNSLNKQKLDQLSSDLETVSRTLTELKLAQDGLSAKLESSTLPQQQMPPPPPPFAHYPPHPFHHGHHGHHHRRHHPP